MPGADDRDGLARLDVGLARARAASTRAARRAPRPRRTSSSGTVCSCAIGATRPSLQPPPVSRQKPVCRPARQVPSMTLRHSAAALRALGARRRTPARSSRARAGRRRARRGAGPRRSRRRPRGRGRTGVDVSVARCSEALPLIERQVGAADAGQARADGSQSGPGRRGGIAASLRSAQRAHADPGREPRGDVPRHVRAMYSSVSISRPRRRDGAVRAPGSASQCLDRPAPAARLAGEPEVRVDRRADGRRARASAGRRGCRRRRGSRRGRRRGRRRGGRRGSRGRRR